MRYIKAVTVISILWLCVLGSISLARAEEAQSIEVKGAKMSKSVFETNFKNNNTHILNQVTNMDDIKEAKLTLSKINYTGNNISFEMQVSDESQSSEVQVYGSLYAGFKSLEGKNSIVGKLVTNGEYQILYFEIFNSTDDSYLMLDCVENGIPYLKMYLLDSSNHIYVFEMELPKILANISASKFERCESDVDIFWASGILDIYQCEEKVTDFNTLKELGLFSITSRALNSFSSYTGFNTYCVNFYDGNDYIQCVSLPYIEYKHVNVTSRDSTWILSFKIAEHCMVNGVTYRSLHNPIRYQNISLKMACGANTTFIRSFGTGRLYECNFFGDQLKSVGNSIGATLLSNVVSKIPFYSTYDTVLGYLNNLKASDKKIELGGPNWDAYGNYVNAIGATFDNHELYECTNYNGKINNGHYITMQGVLQYEGDGKVVDTNGAFSVSFDVFNYETTTTTSVTKDLKLGYKAKP